jgi:hypothetical protein
LNPALIEHLVGNSGEELILRTKERPGSGPRSLPYSVEGVRPAASGETARCTARAGADL